MDWLATWAALEEMKDQAEGAAQANARAVAAHKRALVDSRKARMPE